MRFCKLRCHVTAGVALPADEVVAQGGFKRTSSRVHLYKAVFFSAILKAAVSVFPSSRRLDDAARGRSGGAHEGLACS